MDKEPAQTVLARLAPNANEIRGEADSEIIRFFDCDENHESIRCGACGVETSDGVWGDWMSTDFGSGSGF